MPTPSSNLSVFFRTVPATPVVHDEEAQIGKLMKSVLSGAGGREWEGYRVDRAEVQTVNSAGNPDQQTRYTVARVGEDGGGVV